MTMPQIVEDVREEDLLNRYIERLRDRAPQWLPEPSDPAYAQAQEVAALMYILRQYFNTRALGLFRESATGRDLELLAGMFGVTRMAGESDAALRQRWVVFDNARPDGTKSGIEHLAQQVFLGEEALDPDEAVRYAEAQYMANGVINVYIVSTREGDSGNSVLQGQASADLIAAVQNALNGGVKPPDHEYYVSNPLRLAGHTPYTIRAIVDYSTAGAVPASTISENVISALNQFVILNNRPGTIITRSGVIEAVEAVEGVLSVVVYSDNGSTLFPNRLELTTTLRGNLTWVGTGTPEPYFTSAATDAQKDAVAQRAVAYTCYPDGIEVSDITDNDLLTTNIAIQLRDRNV